MRGHEKAFPDCGGDVSSIDLVIGDPWFDEWKAHFAQRAWWLDGVRREEDWRPAFQFSWADGTWRGIGETQEVVMGVSGDPGDAAHLAFGSLGMFLRCAGAPLRGHRGDHGRRRSRR